MPLSPRLSALGALLLGSAFLATPGWAQPNPEPINIYEVVDGDTVHARFPDGRNDRVRLIGIDAPESVDPLRPAQCFSSESSTRLRDLVLGRDVLLETDTEERDRFGRLLAYVWLDEVLINEQMVADGFAVPLTVLPNTRYVDRLAAAADKARMESQGLWLACVETQVATAPEAPAPPPADTGTPPVTQAQEIAPPHPTATRVPLPTESPPAPPPPSQASAGGRTSPVNRSCPQSHPIKGNQGSRSTSEWIYHVPGQQAYNVTVPEECFATEADAVAAGYRRAQR